MPPRIGSPKKQWRRAFFREWRDASGMSQDRVVERVRERVPSFSKSTLSRLENGKQGYTQAILEALAWAYRCEPQDLLMRKPDSEIWSILDTLEALPPADRAQVSRIVSTFRKAS